MFPGSVRICLENAPFHETPVMGFGASTRSINDGNPMELKQVGRLSYLIFTSTWNRKHPLFNGCFSWMIPNLYIENGCFTKHPLKNGCLGFQVLYRSLCGTWMSTWKFLADEILPNYGRDDIIS